MTRRALARTSPLLLLTAAGLGACASPRDELVPYMSQEGVANAAYTATYNGTASAAGTPRVRPAVVEDETAEPESEAAAGELAS